MDFKTQVIAILDWIRKKKKAALYTEVVLIVVIIALQL